MKRILLLSLLLLSISFNSYSQRQDIDVELLTGIIAEKQDEIKRRFLKSFLLNKRNASSSNMATFNTVNNLLNIIVLEKNKTVMTKDLYSEIATYSVAYILANELAKELINNEGSKPSRFMEKFDSIAQGAGVTINKIQTITDKLSLDNDSQIESDDVLGGILELLFQEPELILSCDDLEKLPSLDFKCNKSRDSTEYKYKRSFKSNNIQYYVFDYKTFFKSIDKFDITEFVDGLDNYNGKEKDNLKRRLRKDYNLIPKGSRNRQLARIKLKKKSIIYQGDHGYDASTSRASKYASKIFEKTDTTKVKPIELRRARRDTLDPYKQIEKEGWRAEVANLQKAIDFLERDSKKNGTSHSKKIKAYEDYINKYYSKYGDSLETLRNKLKNPIIKEISVNDSTLQTQGQYFRIIQERRKLGIYTNALIDELYIQMSNSKIELFKKLNLFQNSINPIALDRRLRADKDFYLNQLKEEEISEIKIFVADFISKFTSALENYDNIKDQSIELLESLSVLKSTNFLSNKKNETILPELIRGYEKGDIQILKNHYYTILGHYGLDSVSSFASALLQISRSLENPKRATNQKSDEKELDKYISLVIDVLEFKLKKKIPNNRKNINALLVKSSNDPDWIKDIKNARDIIEILEFSEWLSKIKQINDTEINLFISERSESFDQNFKATDFKDIVLNKLNPLIDRISNTVTLAKEQTEIKQLLDLFEKLETNEALSSLFFIAKSNDFNLKNLTNRDVENVIGIFSTSLDHIENNVGSELFLIKVGRIITKYVITDLNDNDPETVYNFKIDVPAVITVLLEEFQNFYIVDIKNHPIGVEPFFSLGINHGVFDVWTNSTIENSNGDGNIRNVTYASEKLGLRFVLADFGYARSQKSWYKYKGRYNKWNEFKRDPLIHRVYFNAYGSGLLYNIVNVKTEENFDFPMLGFGFGVTFFNELDLSVSYNLPFIENRFDSNNGFLNFGFDIPIFQYIDAGNKRK